MFPSTEALSRMALDCDDTVGTGASDTKWHGKFICDTSILICTHTSRTHATASTHIHKAFKLRVR